MMRFSHGLVPLFLFLCVLVWSCSETVHCQNQTLPQIEVDALKKIGAKLGKRWDFTVNPCSGTSGWVDPPNSNSLVEANVTCGACKVNYCHVTDIILTGQNLTGFLPDEFSNLTSLKFIDLNFNYLNGSIPASWASIPLTGIWLMGNRITGRIPDELGRITTLEYLILASNLIEGPLPQSLGNLTNLWWLDLNANNIIGRLPESLGNLKKISHILIGGNPITGKIPDFIGNWTQLQRLVMLGTSMEGPFPPIFSTLRNIKWLLVSDLQGDDGKFPQLQNMTNLYSLTWRKTSTTGELPTYIGNLTALRYVDLSFNAFSGQIPDTLKSLANLTYLLLNNNKLTGAIPNWMLTSGIHIDISYNSFNGSNAPNHCSTSNLNMVSSYSTTDDKSIRPCLRRNNPCSGIPTITRPDAVEGVPTCLATSHPKETAHVTWNGMQRKFFIGFFPATSHLPFTFHLREESYSPNKGITTKTLTARCLWNGNTTNATRLSSPTLHTSSCMLGIADTAVMGRT